MAFAAHTSQNYSIYNIAIIPGSGGASEGYRLYDVAEEPTGSGKGTSADYNLWIGFPATVGVLRVPGSLSAGVDSNVQITVSWDANGNPGGVTYQLQEVTPVSQSLYSGANTSHAHSSLTPGAQYCYKVRAYSGVYTVYSGQVCAYTPPGEPSVTSSHTQGAFSTDATVDFNASADANHFYYTWDQIADTAVSAGGTWWSGLQLEKTAASDGNWYFHVRSASVDNNLNEGGTMHYGPYNIDSNEPYTADDGNSIWQTTDVTVAFTVSDNASGVANTYYCIDTENSCTPTTDGTSANVTCSTTCQKYVRFYSIDSAGNSETVRSRLVKIDKEAPSTPTASDEGTTSSDLVLTFTYTTEDNSGSGVADFWLELRTGATDGNLIYNGWTGDSDGSYDYLGALEAYTYYARGKVKDSLEQESSFSTWTDAVYVNSTSHPASANYALDMYAVIPSGQVESTNYSIYDLVIGQPSVSMSSSNYEAETGFAGGFMENSAPTVSFNSPNSGYYGSEVISVDFNIIEAEGDIVYINLAYSTAAGAFQVSLLNDVNLNDYANVSSLSCDDNDFSDSTNCIYSWDTASVQDNNYYFDFNTWDSQGLSNSVSSSTSISVDKSGPSTTSNYNGEWSGVDINVALTCDDGSGSGCALTQYRLDSNPTKTVSFGAWQTYTAPFEVTGDGNWAVDFNSKDSTGAIETTNREYVKINYALSSTGLEIPAGFEVEISEDMNKRLWYKCVDAAGNIQDANSIIVCLDRNPPTTSDDINSEWQGSDFNVTLTPYDAASGVANSYYCIDDSNSCTPTTAATTFAVTCDENTVCTKYVRYYSVDNADSSEDTHGVKVRIDKNGPYTTSTFYAGWQGDLNLQFTCNDFGGSGCQKFVYRIDSGEWIETSFDNNDVNIEIASDGNHLVEFYSVDNANKNGLVDSNYQAVDKTVPGVTITDPSTDYMEKGTVTIAFNVGRLSGSALNSSSIAVDFNGTASDDFNLLADCTQNGAGDYNCSYTELGLAEDDYNLSVYAEDNAGNAYKASRVFTYLPIVAVRNVSPSGGFVEGMQPVSFEVKNTMQNNSYAKVFASTWFAGFDNNVSDSLALDSYAAISGLDCQDATFWDWTQCTYDWNSHNLADGNYFIDVNFWTETYSVGTANSAQPVLVDNTPPEASVAGVSSSLVYEDLIYLSCVDSGSGCRAEKWYYFTSTASCSTAKSDYVNSTTADTLLLVADHTDYLCLWVEDKADRNSIAISDQLHIDAGIYIVGDIPSESQSIVTQDLNNECTMHFGTELLIACDFKSTIKISEYEKDINRVWQDTPDLVVSPRRNVRVLLQSAIEAFYHKDYYLKFESDARTVTSQGVEKEFPMTVVRRRVIPLLTEAGELDVGTLTIKVRQR